MNDKKLSINKQVHWQDNHWYFTYTKYNSDRIIDLDDFTVNILKQYKKQQIKDRIYYGESYTKIKVNNKN